VRPRSISDRGFTFGTFVSQLRGLSEPATIRFVATQRGPTEHPALRGWQIAVSLIVAGFGARGALAYHNGVAGYSGQSGPTCTACHSGGGTPVVFVSGPSSLDAGDVGSFTFTIMGGAANVGGLDIGVSGDATLVPGSDTISAGGDITHPSPKAFASGTVMWSFSLQTGYDGGLITLYAAGNSCNGDGTPNGDDSADTTFTVQVAPGSAPPPPDAGAPPDSGTPVPDSGTTTGTDAGGTTPPPDGGSTGGDDGGNLAGTVQQAVVTEASFGTGCAAASGAPVLLLAAWVLSRVRRNRLQG
jgi:hypothetical protein